MPTRLTTRHVTRPVTTAAALLMAAPAVVPLSPTAARAGDQPPPAVHGWSVELDRRAAGEDGQLVGGRRGFETVGVTWNAGDDPHVEVRTRSGGQWSAWQEAAGLVEGKQGATEPLWVGDSTAVRVRVGEWREDLSVVMVDPGEDPQQEESATTTQASFVTAAATTATVSDRYKRRHRAPMPRLRWRKAWGANESLRDGDPVYLKEIKQAHVHHTAGSTGYTRDEVPGIIRSMYWYHTKQLGWSDIGYNFLVDRFGRTWVGRAGGPRGRVRGAHTLGFNHSSFGVASIGNHEEAGIPLRVRRALVRLIAWKFDKEGRNPGRSLRITSHGSDRYAAGVRVRLPAVTGHRDTNATACPGILMYDELPRLRRQAQNRVDNWG